ncbi:SpoIIE family protein phosphatase [Actinomadura miaoliensis]|uniref:SpoIIE family protein phosphatase n=1 Tax=Actinomadura miaoliensis TaxID=430685 RepID=A0ABP7X386_9ACTN
MSEGLVEGPQERPDRVRHERLRLLEAVDPGVGGTDVLRSALAHAMAELGGLGGMAHLGAGGVAGELSLAASSGLPSSFTRAWQIIPQGDSAAPAEAGRAGRPVWRPVIESPAAWSEEALRPTPPRLPVAAGMISVPLPGPAGSLGALSVLVPSDAEPADDEQQFLQDVARKAAEVLLRAVPDASTAGAVRHAGKTGDVEPAGTAGTWELDLVTGRVVYSESLSGLIGGIDFHGPRERFESWKDVIHPDDLPNVGKDLDRAMRSDSRYETEFRVRHTNGSYGRLRIRATITVDEPGGVIRLAGTAWDTTWDTDEDHAALNSVARLLSAVRAASARAALIDQLTRALTEAVTTQNVVSAVAESVLPAFHASGLLICEVQDGRMLITGAAGYSQEFIDRLSGSPFPPDSPFGQALRTRVPLFFASAKEIVARYPGVAGYPMAEDKDARAFLPLIASGRVIGTGVLSFAGSRHLSREERTLLTALSGLIAQALERARLYDDAATRARELQRDLLPRELPALPCLSAEAHYRPAGYGAEVGGDWYDVIPLSSDRVAVVIGDVMGHGIAEAATMGRLRTAVRTLSELDLPPDDILDRLNAIVGDLGEEYFATCLYGVYDPVTGVLSFASAGHPPPAIVRPDGTAAYLTAAGNPPLGAAAPPFDTMAARLGDGGLLVLYTDGLVEAIDRDIDTGMAHLTKTLTDTLRDEPDMPLRAVRDTVTRALLPAQAPIADDAALLVLRTHRLAPENVVSWTFADDPRAAGLAREHVRAQLAAWGLGEELLMTTELLVSELVGNVVRHAKGPIGLRMIRSWTLTCEVSDASLTTPLIRRSEPTDEGGRGLQLVAALSHRWGTRYSPGGKTIWIEQRIPHPGHPCATAGAVDHWQG